MTSNVRRADPNATCFLRFCRDEIFISPDLLPGRSVAGFQFQVGSEGQEIGFRDSLPHRQPSVFSKALSDQIKKLW